MKKIIPVILSCVLVMASWASTINGNLNSENADAIVKVKGMVCSFCSAQLEKFFVKEKKLVQSFNIDMDNNSVYLKFQKGQKMSEKRISEIVEASTKSVDSVTYKTAAK